MSFGDFVKEIRLGQKKTLRQFCVEFAHDPSNWSKMERGINPPPKDEIALSRWAQQLGLTPASEEWGRFMDLAALSRGQLPADIMQDDQLVEKLPVFFRAMRGADVSEDQLESFIESIRKVNSPDEN